MARLDAIGITCAAIAESIRFYRLLGLEFPNETEEHVDASIFDPDGNAVDLFAVLPEKT